MTAASSRWGSCDRAGNESRQFFWSYRLYILVLMNYRVVWCQKWKLSLPEQRVDKQSSLALALAMSPRSGALALTLRDLRIDINTIPSSRATAIPLTISVWIWQWKRKGPGLTTWYRTIIHVGPLGPLVRQVSLIRGFCSWKNSGCSAWASSVPDQHQERNPCWSVCRA